LNENYQGDALYETFGVTSVPAGDNGEPVTLADLHQMGIASQSEAPEVAWDFIRFFNKNDIAISEYTIPYGVIPALKSEIDNYQEELSDPISQAFIDEVIPSMIGGPYDEKYGQAQQFIIRAMQEVAVGDASVDKALSDLTKNIQTLYQ
jgi:multiple sugar transport system substrate-binding protein